MTILGFGWQNQQPGQSYVFRLGLPGTLQSQNRQIRRRKSNLFVFTECSKMRKKLSWAPRVLSLLCSSLYKVNKEEEGLGFLLMELIELFYSFGNILWKWQVACSLLSICSVLQIFLISCREMAKVHRTTNIRACRWRPEALAVRFQRWSREEVCSLPSLSLSPPA